ncbi:Cyclin-dependent kinase inhibitor domain-containing protein [Dioscorea alata]|uniref:Cyclin-dependent kinase inhibitor domain-containing protein n=1 Tax=Dioscorea alata TaxID=55571 RepID=A0ACB7V875_DIOAL|nr:Cyclin-dependent kinase inhibitor domain-containing protein [Dioscorea alata]
MGKYMKKAKALGGGVALMEVPVPHPSHLGVCTRARTLALQRLQSPSASSPASSSSSSYLQLRSRRLHKVASPTTKPKESPNPSPSTKSSGKVGPCLRPRAMAQERCGGSRKEAVVSEASPGSDAGVEVSFGENVLDSETRNRNTRETTPSSLIRNSETILTPGSTTRAASSVAVNRRNENSGCRQIPTAHEMDEFFNEAEKVQQRSFTEKYNYDVVNDCPLPGRFEWVKLDSQSTDDQP